jgi:hypothetical protein
MIQNCETDLLEMVFALGAAGGFAGGLNRRQQQRDQDADDRNHDQELDERETSPHAVRGPVAPIVACD